MNSITKETRRESYDAILPKVKKRSRLILETLGDRQMTASEITEELVAAGKIPYFNRNYVAPRLTELKDIGVLETVGRRKATRSDATEAVWARKEPPARRPQRGDRLLRGRWRRLETGGQAQHRRLLREKPEGSDRGRQGRRHEVNQKGRAGSTRSAI